MNGGRVMICNLCPRMCAAERDSVNGGGACGMGLTPVLARAALHFDEEPVISGARGSGAVFFSGCALRCVYCQNYEISALGAGAHVSAARLRRIYSELIQKGAHNINLVSPTHFAPAILESLTPPPGVPVIWNSSGYERAETLRAFEGKIDVYLPDFKYASSAVAGKYSGARDYARYALGAIGEMLRQTGPVELDADGVILKGTIIRHLILPGQTENSKRVLGLIRERFPGAWVSLMAQYLPLGEAARFPELNRRVTRAEYGEVVDEMLKLGLEDGFVQELSAANAKYVPAFDLTGVIGEEA